MEALFDFISINKTQYDQLDVIRKEKIELFARKLKEAELENKILALEKGKYHYTIYDTFQGGPMFETNIPVDLQKEIDKVLVHIND